MSFAHSKAWTRPGKPPVPTMPSAIRSDLTKTKRGRLYRHIRECQATFKSATASWRASLRAAGAEVKRTTDRFPSGSSATTSKLQSRRPPTGSHDRLSEDKSKAAQGRKSWRSAWKYWPKLSKRNKGSPRTTDAGSAAQRPTRGFTKPQTTAWPNQVPGSVGPIQRRTKSNGDTIVCTNVDDARKGPVWDSRTGTCFRITQDPPKSTQDPTGSTCKQYPELTSPQSHCRTLPLDPASSLENSPQPWPDQTSPEGERREDSDEREYFPWEEPMRGRTRYRDGSQESDRSPPSDSSVSGDDEDEEYFTDPADRNTKDRPSRGGRERGRRGSAVHWGTRSSVDEYGDVEDEYDNVDHYSGGQARHRSRSSSFSRTERESRPPFDDSASRSTVNRSSSPSSPPPSRPEPSTDEEYIPEFAQTPPSLQYLGSCIFSLRPSSPISGFNKTAHPSAQYPVKGTSFFGDPRFRDAKTRFAGLSDYSRRVNLFSGTRRPVYTFPQHAGQIPSFTPFTSQDSISNDRFYRPYRSGDLRIIYGPPSGIDTVIDRSEGSEEAPRDPTCRSDFLPEDSTGRSEIPAPQFRERHPNALP